MSTAPNMYVSPRYRSGSQIQLNSARRFLNTIVPTGAAEADTSSKPSHSKKRTRAVATVSRMRASAHRSSAVDPSGAVRLENVETETNWRCSDFMAGALRLEKAFFVPLTRPALDSPRTY